MIRFAALAAGFVVMNLAAGFREMADATPAQHDAAAAAAQAAHVRVSSIDKQKPAWLTTPARDDLRAPGLDADNAPLSAVREIERDANGRIVSVTFDSRGPQEPASFSDTPVS